MTPVAPASRTRMVELLSSRPVIPDSCGHAMAAAGPGRHPEVASQGEFSKAGRAGRWPKVVSAWPRRTGLARPRAGRDGRTAHKDPPARRAGGPAVPWALASRASSAGPDREVLVAYVEVGGLRTWHEVQGEGRPVVLLHGGFAGASSWSAQTPVL